MKNHINPDHKALRLYESALKEDRRKGIEQVIKMSGTTSATERYSIYLSMLHEHELARFKLEFEHVNYPT